MDISFILNEVIFGLLEGFILLFLFLYLSNKIGFLRKNIMKVLYIIQISNFFQPAQGITGSLLACD